MKSPIVQTNEFIIKLNLDQCIGTRVFLFLKYGKYLQTVQILMGRLVTSRLIRIYTVCKTWPLHRPVELKG